MLDSLVPRVLSMDSLVFPTGPLVLYGAFIIHLAWGDGEEMRGAGTPLLQPDSGGVSEGARDDTVLGNRQ